MLEVHDETEHGVDGRITAWTAVRGWSGSEELARSADPPTVKFVGRDIEPSASCSRSLPDAEMRADRSVRNSSTVIDFIGPFYIDHQFRDIRGASRGLHEACRCVVKVARHCVHGPLAAV